MEWRSTYTYGALRDAIYKALGDYTENGERISLSFGAAADTEKAFLQTLNMCLRRVCMSLPLLTKRTAATFTAEDGGTSAMLPENFFKAVEFTLNGREVPTAHLAVKNGRLFCKEARAGETGRLDYEVAPTDFHAAAPADKPVELPDVTADALVFLTAAELCPSEDSERYARLLYRYQDTVLNVYNIQRPRRGRNTFFSSVVRGFRFWGR